MARSYVLGLDGFLYLHPISSRISGSANEADDRPQQLWDPDTDGMNANYLQWISGYWVVETAQEVTLNLSSTTADVTSRKSNGWRQIVGALKEGSVDFSILWEPDDQVFTELERGYLEQCPMAFAILDGPIEGFQYQTGSSGPCNETGITVPSTSATRYYTRCDECGLVTGLHGDFIITGFTRNEPPEEAMTVDVTIEPAFGQIHPEWLIIPPRPAA